MKKFLWNILKIPVLIFGIFYISMAIYAHYRAVPTFLRPGYEHFWDDATYYLLQTEGHKTVAELYDQYDPNFVQDFILQPELQNGVIPSEETTLYFLVVFSFKNTDGRLEFDVANFIGGALGFFVMFYGPVLFLIRTLAQSYCWAFCMDSRSAFLFAKHFEAPWKVKLISGLISFPFVVGLAAINASSKMTPALSQVGIDVFTLTVMFVVWSYFAGLGIRFVQGVIEGIFICRGVDPEKSFWDELLTLAITAPVLLFFYRNSPLSTLGDVIAGLGPLLVAKLFYRQSGRDQTEKEGIPAPWPDAIIRKTPISLTVLGVGTLFFCCCGAFTLVTPQEETPTEITIETLQSEGPPEKTLWLQVKDGYLFFPLLVTLDDASGIGDFYQKRYFVPLVNKTVLNEWLEDYQKGKDKAKYSFADCRIFVLFHEAEFLEKFPDMAVKEFDRKQPFIQMDIQGDVGRERLAKYIDFLSQAYPNAENMPDVNDIILINKDRYHTYKWVAFFMTIFGFLALLPVPIRYFTGWPKPQELEFVEPISEPPPLSFNDQGGFQSPTGMG